MITPEVSQATKIGVGVMVLKGDYVLMSFRKSSHGAGTYQFLGGHMEYGESFEECAKREIREECGIEIKNITFMCVANVRAFMPKHYVHIGLQAEWASGEPQLLEPEKNSSWEWYPIDALPNPINHFSNFQLQTRASGVQFFDETL